MKNPFKKHFKKSTTPGRLFSVEGIKITGYAGDSSCIGAIRLERESGAPQRPRPTNQTEFRKK